MARRAMRSTLYAGYGITITTVGVNLRSVGIAKIFVPTGSFFTAECKIAAFALEITNM